MSLFPSLLRQLVIVSSTVRMERCGSEEGRGGPFTCDVGAGVGSGDLFVGFQRAGFAVGLGEEGSCQGEEFGGEGSGVCWD